MTRWALQLRVYGVIAYLVTRSDYDYCSHYAVFIDLGDAEQYADQLRNRPHAYDTVDVRPLTLCGSGELPTEEQEGEQD